MAIGVVEATATTIYPSAGALAADNNLRIASLTMAAYDYLITLPAEYRLYKSSNRRSLGFILFVLIRYTSIIVLVVSNVGFFYHGFTPKACEHYHLAAPALKVVQMMVSQAILAIRTYGISQGNLWVARTLLSTYILGAAFQWFSSLNARILRSSVFSRMVIEIRMAIPTTPRSGKLHSRQRSSAKPDLYLVVLPGSDVIRLSYIVDLGRLPYESQVCSTRYLAALQDPYRADPSASFEYSVTWIMSQRILIHLRDARTDQTPVVLAPLHSSRAVTSASRFEKGMKHQNRAEQGHTPGSQHQFSNTKSDLELQVRIDKSIVVDARQEPPS
ncbi:hypothetical protein EDB84DRAFT_1569651 [Lactarius hengduanensis]|nr:hypothetical protein EDB84DRAFT_1569651 [Lactarius hengduanensis]